jgi:hypothetical protein
MGDLAPSRSTPHQLVAFWLEFKPGGTFASQIVRSVDDGLSWTPAGDVLAPELYPLTIDVAPSLSTRVYLSARGDKAKNYGSMLMRSDDLGATFTSADIPDTQEHRLTYIAAVHPFDPDRVYLRVLDMSGTVIQMTSDGGRTFQKIFTGTDQLLGFAISPDGTQMAVGGPNDGIWVGPADGSGLERRSDIGATCLTWTEDALFVGADYKKADFSIGKSVDSGKSFEGLFRFDKICGRAACGVATSKCIEEWELVLPAIGATCADDAGASDGAAGGTSRDAGSMGGGAGAGGATGGTPNPIGDKEGGCSCTIEGTNSRRDLGAFGVLAWLAAAALRRAGRRARGPLGQDRPRPAVGRRGYR